MPQILELLQKSFDASDRGLRAAPTFLRSIAVALSVCVLVWILKPDLFGLIPNSLDPMFYTGYAINLDDALAAAGNRHYFVTRWTSYMPMYLFSEIFGPYWGRLVLRLIMVVVLSEMLWRLGYRLNFPTKSRLLGIFTVVTAPMFVRAFTTDYPEYFIIWGSMVLALLFVSFAASPSYFKSAMVGLVASSILIANPFTSLLVTISISLAAVLSKLSGVNWRSILISSMVAVSVAFAVLTTGYLLFKIGYQIGDVYEPTLKFMREYERPVQDGWTAPSKAEWLNHFSWLYLTPFLAVLLLSQVRKVLGFKKFVLAYFAMIAVLIYIIHIYVEVRRGNALETSYYWSMSLGPVLIVLYLLLCHFSQSMKTWSTWLSVLVISSIVLWRIPQQFQLPAGTKLFFVLILLFITCFVMTLKIPRIATAALLLVVIWCQIGAPTYTQRSYGGDLNSPRYDLVYNAPDGESHLVLHETLWFLRQMDKFENDWTSTFLTVGGWSAAIVGTYIPHPFSRWIVPVSENKVFSPNVRDELEFSYRQLLVIYGAPQQVGKILTQVQGELSKPREILDVTNKRGLGYRLVVIKSNAGINAQAEIPLSRLDRQIGSARDNGTVFVKGGTRSGFVSFGPYFGLGKGSYTATLEYAADASGPIGYFEVFNDVTQKSSQSTISSHGNGSEQISISFVVENEAATWQLRTVYTGQMSVSFRTIVLQKTKEG